MEKLPKINIIYEDNHLLVVEKPVGIPVQEDSSKDIDMITILKEYRKKKENKTGNAYIGLVHRLDRPVGGIMVFAKTSKAAARLSDEIRKNNFHKTYIAVVEGIIMDPPSYGRGPNKEVWKFENDFPILLEKVKDVLDDDYSFLLISSYTTGISHISLENILKLEFKNAKVETGENTLPVTEDNLILPCGIYGKVTKN